jgi:hypothetical protein
VLASTRFNLSGQLIRRFHQPRSGPAIAFADAPGRCRLSRDVEAGAAENGRAFHPHFNDDALGRRFVDALAAAQARGVQVEC